MRALAAIFVSLMLALPAAAQDRPNTILVLDGSGSMWGQIDGVAKISIAQKVVAELLGSIPPEQSLGLTVYGHRRRGDCTDIETVVAPGTGSREAIAAAVNAIQPRGKTPMTDAVQAAAEALRYTEEAATVILVSDGIETCNPDPCAAARVLEETGVNFTAHVVGFDVTDTQALAQMRCIAEETGGTFLTAANAAELTTAMTAVAATPPPEPTAFDVTFNAKDGPGGPTITEGLYWTVTDANGAPLLDGGNDMTPTLELLPGDYTARVTREVDGASGETGFSIDTTHRTVAVVLPELPPEPVRVIVYATDGKNGPRIGDDLVWDLSGGETAIQSEMTPSLDLELVEGEYLVSVLRPADEAYAEVRFGVGERPKTVTLVLPEYRPLATVEGPATGVAGDTVQVRWTGPNAKNDYVSVALPGERGDIGYAYTNNGPLLEVQLPPEPGEYEFRYILGDGRKTLATQKVIVTPVTATLTPEGPLPAGGTVMVRWDGPDYRNDYIDLVKPGDDTSVTYAYTTHGSPAELRLPAEPGDYEMRYVMNQGRTELVRIAVSVTSVSATVTPPATMAAGELADVGWTGPDDQSDYIAIFPAGADRYAHYAYTRNGNPAELQMPAEPGDYVIAYVQNQGDTILASVPVTVGDVTASISPPAELPAGGNVKVGWTGPANRNDYIAVFPAGADRYVTYAYTRNGDPAEITLPAEPGAYEIRYVMSTGERELASVPITVTAVGATLAAPGDLPAGAQVDVAWTGPDNRNDFIALFPVGEDRYVTYAYTRNGSPAEINLPAEPGAYELAYVLNQGNTVIARVPVTITPVQAALVAPDRLEAGATVSVPWKGPGYRRDYIAIMERGGDKNLGYSLTRNGNPAEIALPGQPGEYDLVYVLDAGNTPLARVAVTVTPAFASLIVPEALTAGATVSIAWKGPDNPRDYIAVTERGEDKTLLYTRTSRGQPAELKLPDAPGEYDLVYVLNQGNTIIARVPVSVK